jgi:putative flippase GtrA
MIRLPRRVRFLLVGGTCAVLQNAVIITFDFLHIHYAAAVTVAFVLALVTGFALHNLYTFKTTPTLRAFFKYAAGMSTNYPIYMLLMFVLCDLLHIRAAISGLIATALMVAWNYVLSRWAIMGGHRAPNR